MRSRSKIRRRHPDDSAHFPRTKVRAYPTIKSRSAPALFAIVLFHILPAYAASPGILERAEGILSSTVIEGHAQVDVSSEVCPFATETELSTIAVAPEHPTNLMRLTFAGTTVFSFAQDGDPFLELVIRFTPDEPCFAVVKRMSF